MIVFYILAGLLIVQGLFSLIEGVRYLSFVRSSHGQADGGGKPKAAIIAPCKGLEPSLEENLGALFEQDYPDYEIVFVVATAEDQARAVIERLIEKHPGRAARLVVAGLDARRSQKVTNLLSAIEQVNPGCRILAFVDSDARAHTGWLADLASRLEDTRVGAATGYRWYVPDRGGFWSAMLSAWNGSVATTLGDHGRNFAWGGATAIRRETFDKIGVKRYWETAVSDDYALTRAVKAAGLRVSFVPRCLMASREDMGFSSLIEFTTRQVTITRVYRPDLWWTGIVSHALFGVVFFGGAAFALTELLQGASAAASIALLAAVYVLGSMKGLLRLVAARAALHSLRREVTRAWWMFCLLWPLVSLMFLYNFIRSAMTRRIKWRGVVYEMHSPAKTVVVKGDDSEV